MILEKNVHTRRALTGHLVLLLLAVAWTGAGRPVFAQRHVPSAHHGFSDVEKWAPRFESAERTAWQRPDKVVMALKLAPGAVVADIGAGTGYFTRRFARAVGKTGQAFGLDTEPGMVRYMKADAKKRGLQNYHARVVQPGDPGLPPHSTDVVFLCDTYHHIHNRPAYFRGLVASLKPGGRVVIVDFLKHKLPVGPPPAHKIARAKTIEEFQKAGFRLARSHDFLPYQYFLEFEANARASAQK